MWRRDGLPACLRTRRRRLGDREVNLGYAFNEGEAGYQQSFISGYRRDYVNGQFSLADLAPAWQQKLSASLPKPAAGTR